MRVVPLEGSPPAGAMPPYRRIADQIRRAILRGDYAPGDRLPSLRDLAGEEGVNPNTIQHVYDLLEEEGWIERRHGAGTFAREPAALPRARRRGVLREALGRARGEARRVGASEEEWREGERSAREEIPLLGEREAARR